MLCYADLHMAQLMPLPLTVSCFSKIQIGFTFLVPVLRNQMTPLIFDPRVVIFRNILTPGHSVSK